MKILLEEFYKTDIIVEKYHDRKVFIDDNISYQIHGITQSGKSKLVKHYLLSLKKSAYLYINCNDVRIDIEELNKELSHFCNKNKITTVALDNYNPNINLINISQVIVTSQVNYKIDMLQTLQLFPLDYEEFLAYEHKYDSSALNHFFQLGGLPIMHTVASDERNIFLQQTLKYTLSDIEFDILCYCARILSQKVSPFSIYERLKLTRKISKDKLYKSFESILSKGYIYNLEKLNYPQATKKIFLCDIAIKSAFEPECLCCCFGLFFDSHPKNQ